VTIAQYSLTAILLFVIFQILMTSHYYVGTLIAVTAISYTLNVTLLGLFAQRLFTWYRSNRNTIVVLLYGLSAAALAISTGLAVIYDCYTLLNKQEEITPQSKVVYPSPEPGSVMDKLSETYQYSDLVSFVLVWGSTALLLRHYSQRIGKAKYWILISLPLVYFLGSFIEFFNLYNPETDSEWFYYYLSISLNSTAGGILFGLAFRAVARSISHNSAVRLYDYFCIWLCSIVYFKSVYFNTCCLSTVWICHRLIYGIIGLFDVHWHLFSSNFYV
jgi:hypothetical protein